MRLYLIYAKGVLILENTLQGEDRATSHHHQMFFISRLHSVTAFFFAVFCFLFFFVYKKSVLTCALLVTSCMHIKGGTWSPYGFTISETSVPEDKFGKLQAYGRQLERIGASDVSYGGAGADVGIWCQLNGTQQPGVPCGSLIVRSLPSPNFNFKKHKNCLTRSHCSFPFPSTHLIVWYFYTS